MKSFVDKLVDFAKELPGFGLVFIIITVAYAYLKESHEELTAIQTLVAAVICWGIYHGSSLLDYLYNLAYGPNSKLSFLWKFDDLQEARNAAAKALFSPMNPSVENYAAANRHHYVGDKPLKSLYSFCSAVAKPTDVWGSKIAPKISVSKTARTLFVFTLVLILLIKIKLLRDLFGVPALVERLGVLSNIWLLVAIAFVAFVIYVVLRVLHNIELFEYVAGEVVHVAKRDNKMAVMILDVILPRQRLPLPQPQGGNGLRGGKKSKKSVKEVPHVHTNPT